LDEHASIDREAWPEVLRPALADKQRRALFIGTPRGYNHFYDPYIKTPRPNRTGPGSNSRPSRAATCRMKN
jgi:hypothetical protein